MAPKQHTHTLLKSTVYFTIGTFLLLFGNNVNAQDNFLSFSINTHLGRLNQPALVQFNETYNEVNANVLDQKMGNMKTARGFGYEITYLASVLYLNWEHKSSYTSSHSTFLNPAFGKRYFKQMHNYNTLAIGFVITETDNDGILVGGVGFSHCSKTLSSYKKYQNGDISFGNESILNGKYTAQNFAFTLDMSVMQSLSRSVLDRWFLNIGGELRLALGGHKYREAGSNKNLELPGIKDVSSMEVGFNFKIGLRYALFNNL